MASPFIKFTALFLLVAVFCSCSNDHVVEAGGAYANSPDGKWMAEIYDGYSKTHRLPYAIIRLWDLKKYPSMTDGIYSYSGKSPTVQLEFPQRFFARDSNCKVTWETNSLAFFISYDGDSGSSTNSNLKPRRFQYNLLTDIFSVEIIQ